MLIGEFKHTLDDKNRLSLPARFRKELGKKVVLTRGLDRCVFVYQIGEWKKLSERLAEASMGKPESRAFNRFILGGAIETDVDTSGRILIPDFLKTFATLSTKVVIAGIHNRLEIWDEKTWKKYTTRVEGEADALAEKLSDIGMM
jgi:MraZ protein